MARLPASAGGPGPNSYVVNDGQLDVSYVYQSGNGVDGNLLTIVSTEDGVATTRIYELDTAAAPGAVTAGNVRVDISGGAGAAATITALVAAINADGNRVCNAVDIGGDAAALVALRTGQALTATETLANGALGNATFPGSAGTVPLSIDAQSYTVTAQDVTTWASGATSEVPIGAVRSTSQPTLVSLNRFTAAGGVGSPVTMDAVWRQANSDAWVLCVTDPGAICAATNRLVWVAVAAIEA